MSDKPLQDDELFLRLAQETETAPGARTRPLAGEGENLLRPHPAARAIRTPVESLPDAPRRSRTVCF